MDIRGILIFAIIAALYLLSKRMPGWLFIASAGAGIGLLIGGIWLYAIVRRAIDALVP